jgi:hypothetical protein
MSQIVIDSGAGSRKMFGRSAMKPSSAIPRDGRSSAVKPEFAALYLGTCDLSWDRDHCKIAIGANEVLGNNRRSPQQSRLELGLCFSRFFSPWV